MTYTVPRQVYEKLAETLNDREVAEKFVQSIEGAVQEAQEAFGREIGDRMTVVKSDLKDDLTATLVTKELFESTILLTREHFDESIRSTREHLEGKIESTREHLEGKIMVLERSIHTTREIMDEKFKRMELWFKVLVGLSLFGITLANPGFIALIEKIFR